MVEEDSEDENDDSEDEDEHSLEEGGGKWVLLYVLLHLVSL